MVRKSGNHGASVPVKGTYRYFFGAAKERDASFHLDDYDLLTYDNEWQEE